MRIRVKICGITREQDALLAAEAGADAIGLHWARSPRAVDVQRARSIQAQLPPFVSTVALFVDPSADTVWQVIEATRPDLLQFHGNEEPSFCSAFGVPYIKALKITDRAPDATALGYHAQARGFLLDSHDPVAIGGTGRAFDWSLAPHRNDAAGRTGRGAECRQCRTCDCDRAAVGGRCEQWRRVGARNQGRGAVARLHAGGGSRQHRLIDTTGTRR